MYAQRVDKYVRHCWLVSSVTVVVLATAILPGCKSGNIYTPTVTQEITSTPATTLPFATPGPAMEEESKAIAEEYVRNNSTFAFDGIGDSLLYIHTIVPECCEQCYMFKFVFNSRNAGYGNRTGQQLTNEITPHFAYVVVEKNAVSSANLDSFWDMMTEQPIDGAPSPTPLVPAETSSPTPITTSIPEVISEEASRVIAENFVRQDATFLFDGIEGSLKWQQTVVLRCPQCWLFEYQFKSSHAGYGDRTGQVLAQVITSHIARVTVIKGEVTSAILDDKWDIITEEQLTAINKTTTPTPIPVGPTATPTSTSVPATDVSATPTPDVALMESSRKVAEDFITSSPEFLEGVKGSLILTGIRPLWCAGCWMFTFEFKTLVPNLDGSLSDETVTHTAKVTMISGEVNVAAMDEEWNMLEHRPFT